MSRKSNSPANSAVAALLSAAAQRHQAGDLAAADAGYADVLTRAPDDAQALYLAGALDHQLGRDAAAFDKLERSLIRRPDYLPAIEMLGAVAAQVGRFDRAVVCFRIAAERKPAAETHFNLGTALFNARAFTEAAAVFRRAAALKPNHAEALYLLAAALRSDRQFESAAEAYAQLLELQPENALALDEYGGVLFELERNAEAEEVLHRAIAAAPESPNAYTNLGRLFQNDRARAGEALALHEQALARRPDYADAHNNKGAALTALSRFAEAAASFSKAIALKPGLAEAHNNLGNALYRRGDIAGSMRALEEAVRLKPQYGEAHWNLALALLTQGDYARGWVEYEWRWQCRDFRFPPRGLSQKTWKGEDTDGPLLVWGEQGLGDEILYGAMAADLAASGRPLMWECDLRLIPLIARSYPHVRTIARTTPPDSVTDGAAAQISTASLGQYLRRSGGDFPDARKAYFAADLARSAGFRERLLKGGKKRVIGLSWESKNQDFGVHKSCDLKTLAPLFDAAGFETAFVDLQYGDTQAERDAAGLKIEHLDDVDLFNDIDGIAALIKACDLVITVSNTTAHLAGALGVPVWVMTSTGNGRLWYWGAGVGGSRWYPSAETFRQDGSGDWSGVVARIAARLSGSPAIPLELLPQAAALHQAGRLAEAEARYRDVLAAAPQNYNALHMLGVVHLQTGRASEALRLISTAIGVNAADAVAFNHQGQALSALGRFDEALESLAKALALSPGDNAIVRSTADVLNNRGVALQAEGRQAEALTSYKRSIALTPTAAAYSNRGDLLRVLGRDGDAVASYDEALALDPRLGETWAKRGNALRAVQDYDGAVASFDRALAIDPALTGAAVNRATVLNDAGREGEALAAFDEVLARDPNHIEAHWNRARVLLARGIWSQAWRDFEWRWQTASFVARPFPQPAWRGEPVSGPLLVWSEQGLGDEILFASMLGGLRSADIMFEVDPRLVALFTRSFPHVTVVPRGNPPVAETTRAVAQIAAGSLGQYLRRDAASFPANPGYLKVDDARTQGLRARLLGPGKTLLIGVSWVSKNQVFGARKTCALKDLAPLWQAAGGSAQFVDLQYGDTSEERAAAGLDLAHLPDLDLTHDIDGLAALIKACDVVVTVSNTTAHLAGALGVPTCVLVAKGSGRLWAWGPTPSPWYPSAAIFKQEAVGSWDGVIAQVCAQIRGTP